MKYKLHPFERAVGFFLAFALVGSLIFGVFIAINKKWFEEKSSYFTYVKSASNIRVGSSVLMAGLKVGQIERIDLDRTQQIKVVFKIFKKYSFNMTEGTKAQFLRPFVIGERTLTITPGVEGGKILAANTPVPLVEAADLMDLIGSGKIEAMVTRVDNILKSLDETMLMGKDIAFQVSDKQRLQKTLENVAIASAEVRKALPHILEKAPQVVSNLETITSGLKEVQPSGTEKTLRLIDESVVILQAMQKNFFLRGGVKEVKAERAAQESKASGRIPASE